MGAENEQLCCMLVLSNEALKPNKGKGTLRKSIANMCPSLLSFFENKIKVLDVLEFRECTKDQENEKPWKSVESYTLQGLNEDTISQSEFLQTLVMLE